MAWIVTFVSPTNDTAQLSIVRQSVPVTPQGTVSVSIETDDVHRAYDEAVRRGYRIVYPMTDEPWGVRRFHVTDPNGIIVNVMSHIPTLAEND